MNPDVDCTTAETLRNEAGLDLSETRAVPYQPIAEGDLDGLDIRPEHEAYQALSHEQEQLLRNEVLEKWEAADSVLKNLTTWKEYPKPSDPARQTHEKLVKQTFDVACDIIGEGANADAVTDEHNEVMKCLYCLGQQFLRTLHDNTSSITCYRGLGYNLPFLAKQILKTDEPEYTFNTTVVTNFTSSEARSLEHSRVQARLNIEFDGIILPIDQLLKYWDGGEVTERDGELQVCGDVIPDLPNSEVYVVLQDGRRSLQGLFQTIPELSRREHFTVRDIVIEMAYRELQLDTNDEDESTADDGVQTLKDWFARFTVEYPGEASLVQDLYEYVIGMRSSRPDSHDLFQGR